MVFTTEALLRSAVAPGLRDPAGPEILRRRLLLGEGVSRDVTASKRLEIALRECAEKVGYFAGHDTLTGLENRQSFMTALEHALALTRRGGATSTPLYLDIDRFRRCNDERGRAFGDEVLISLAGRLRAGLREVDLLAGIKADMDADRIVSTANRRVFEHKAPRGGTRGATDAPP